MHFKDGFVSDANHRGAENAEKNLEFRKKQERPLRDLCVLRGEKKPL